MDVDKFFDDIFSSHNWQTNQPEDSTSNDGSLVTSLDLLIPAEISLNDFPEISYDDIITVASFGDESSTRLVSHPSMIPSADQTRGAELSGVELAVKFPPTHVVEPASARWRTCMTVELESSPPAKNRQQSRVLTSRRKKKNVTTAHSNHGFNSRRPSMRSQSCRDSIRLQPHTISQREEHILRERKRRDEMAERFLLLEKILTPQPRRQKAVIVEDAIKLVKSLQNRKTELLKRRTQIQNRSIISKTDSYPISCQSNKGAYDPSSHMTTDPNLKLWPARNKLRAHDASDDRSSRDDDELFQIHAQVSEDEVLVEMMFRHDSPHLHTRVMQTVESARLEVVRGSMQRSAAPSRAFIEFIIAAKMCDGTSVICSLHWNYVIKTYNPRESFLLELCKQLSNIDFKDVLKGPKVNRND